MLVNIPLTTWQEVDLPDEVLESILLRTLYVDYKTSKESFTAEEIKAIKTVFMLYSNIDIDEVGETFH